MSNDPQPKNGVNAQWGLVSETGGDAVPATPAAAVDGDGVAPLVDEFGRPWVRNVGGGPPPPPFVTRVEYPIAVTDIAATRVVFAGAGMSEQLQLWVQHIEGIWFDTGELVWLQVHDKAVPVIGGDPAIFSLPIRRNFDVLSIGQGITVVDGLALVVSNRALTYLPFVGNAARQFFTEGVALT